MKRLQCFAKSLAALFHLFAAGLPMAAAPAAGIIPSVTERFGVVLNPGVDEKGSGILAPAFSLEPLFIIDLFNLDLFEAVIVHLVV